MNLTLTIIHKTKKTNKLYYNGDYPHLRRHALIQYNFFYEIRTPTENKHARIVVIGQEQIQEPMKLSQIEKQILQTLTNSKDAIQKGQEYARRSSRSSWIMSFEFVKVCGIRFSIQESFIGFCICCYPITTILACLFSVGVRISWKTLC